jgi:hypothetical protein
MSPEELLANALELAAHGLRPVPGKLIDGKIKPAGPWRDKPSTDEAAVRAWFSQCAQSNALMVATGGGIVVVDLDRGHAGGADGIASFGALVRELGGLPQGPRVRTPGGGLHLWLSTPADRRIRNSVGKIGRRDAPGVDVRGDGGLATVPPTVRGERSYVWAPSVFAVAIPPAPRWLLDLIAPAQRVPCTSPLPPMQFSGISPYASKALRSELEALARTGPGARNLALFKASANLGGLAAGGLIPFGLVAQGLLAAAHDCGLIADDGQLAVEATIRSGLETGKAAPRQMKGVRHG